MPKKPTDALLSYLFHDIDDLTSPHPLLLNRLTSEFGKAKVHALLEQKLLKLAGYQTTFECPEDCPERCVLAVERDADGNLFGYCGREDMAAIPIAKDDLKACVLDFLSIADFVAHTLGREPQRNETPGQFLACYLKGGGLRIEAGAPVTLCIDDNKCALAEALAWTGTRFTVLAEEVWNLAPATRGTEEPTEERYARYYRRFEDLKKQFPKMEDRYKYMAQENGESPSNVRRIVTAERKRREKRRYSKNSKN
ncbi:MAG: hypothetical protein PUG38_05915 [Sutterellaceae bacterium]|nr:hypothetical protein [Sutterellaceae bacterium]